MLLQMRMVRAPKLAVPVSLRGSVPVRRNIYFNSIVTRTFHSQPHNNSRFKPSEAPETLLKRKFGSIKEEPLLDKDISEQYLKGHFPLILEGKYGPPFTNVAEVEAKTTPKVSHSFTPVGFADKSAHFMVTCLRPLTHLFFRDKYTHHAVVLETVAAVPGMVAGMLRHFRSLRSMSRDFGWIGQLLEEAENERMHLLTWMQLVKPTTFERILVMAAQCVYTPFYATLYILSPRTAHRFVGYLEEEAVQQYTLFLEAIDKGKIPNYPAPEIAIKYWNLPPDSKLRDVVVMVRSDEMMHRDLNHVFSTKSKLGLN